MTYNEKKELLIPVIKAENKQLFNGCSKDHIEAIKYLETGILPSLNINKFELLEACINDFETVFKDYVGNDDITDTKNGNKKTMTDIESWVNMSEVTRLEVISKNNGRQYVNNKCIVEASLQDGGRTLKLFVE